MNEQIADIIAQHKNGRGELIPILQKVQETYGYLPKEAIVQISESIGIPPSDIYGVLTFYAQFRTKPTGKNRVMVCRGTACHVKGGPRVLRAVKQTLGVEEGENTADMKYTLETVACIGACSLAPTMMINKDTHGRLTPQKVSAIFGGEKEEKK